MQQSGLSLYRVSGRRSRYINSAQGFEEMADIQAHTTLLHVRAIGGRRCHMIVHLFPTCRSEMYELETTEECRVAHCLFNDYWHEVR